MAEKHPRRAGGWHAGMPARRLGEEARRGRHRPARRPGGPGSRDRAIAPQNQSKILHCPRTGRIPGPAGPPVQRIRTSFPMKATRINLALAYVAGLAGSLWLGYQVRFNFAVPADTERTFLPVFAWVVGFKLFCLWRFGQFDAFLGYFSLPDFSRLFWVLSAASLMVFGASTQLGSDYAPPRGV